LVVVEEGLLLLQEVEEGHLLCLCLCLHQGHHLCHHVLLLLELVLRVVALVPVVVALVPVVVALGPELGEPVRFLQLMLLLHFQTL
jgi:hypothetical protein